MVNVRAHVKNPKQALLAIPLFEQENTAHTARPCGASAALAAAMPYTSVKGRSDPNFQRGTEQKKYCRIKKAKKEKKKKAE